MRDFIELILYVMAFMMKWIIGIFIVVLLVIGFLYLLLIVIELMSMIIKWISDAINEDTNEQE